MNFNSRHIRFGWPILVVFLLLGQFICAQDSIPLKDLETYFDEARLYGNQDKVDMALASLENAAKVAERNEDVKALIDCYHKFAILYLRLDKEE